MLKSPMENAIGLIVSSIPSFGNDTWYIYLSPLDIGETIDKEQFSVLSCSESLWFTSSIVHLEI